MSPPTYDFWLLDLDGTLVDVEERYAETTLDAVDDRLGCGFSPAERRVLWHGVDSHRTSVLEPYGLSLDRFWEVFDEVDDPTARAGATFLYDDAAAIGSLDCPTALVTHCPEVITEAVLDHLDIRDWFDAVVCCTADVGWKPDPEPVEHAMRELGVDPERHRGVLAGDGSCDVGAAWNAGIDGIHVERRNPDDRGYCVVADYRLESFEHLTASSASD